MCLSVSPFRNASPFCFPRNVHKETRPRRTFLPIVIDAPPPVTQPNRPSPRQKFPPRNGILSRRTPAAIQISARAAPVRPAEPIEVVVQIVDDLDDGLEDRVTGVSPN